jgi:AraC-like DNA-binding protein
VLLTGRAVPYILFWVNEGQRRTPPWRCAWYFRLDRPRPWRGVKRLPHGKAVTLSEEHVERVFTRALGKTPSQYILHVRVEAAQRQLDRTDRGLKQIALDCGFGNAEVMRRSFVRLIGITPDQYRGTLNVAKADS